MKRKKEKLKSISENDFKKGLLGIKMLPYSSRGGVFLAYRYYYNLFLKIKAIPSSRVLERTHKNTK